MKHHKTIQEGQVLVEALVALALAVIVISSVSVAILSALKGAQDDRYKTNASQYAQQGIEIMHVMQTIRSSNWKTYVASVSDNSLAPYCLNDGCPYGFDNALCKTSMSCIPIDNIYLRTVTIKNQANSGSCTGVAAQEIDVKVAWADNKCKPSNLYCNSVTSTSCFTNNQQIQAP